MAHGSILVVDDDSLMREFVCEALRRKAYDVDATQDGPTALEKIKVKRYDLVISDIRMPDMDGMTLLKEIKTRAPDTDVVMITAYATIKNAVEAMQKGAFHYIQKPFQIDEIELVVERAMERRKLIDENRHLRSELAKTHRFDRIVGKSQGIRRIFEVIEMVAPSSASVLIHGETGTGKELVADAIHQCSPRKDASLIKVNCAALPEGLMESELFGHEKGAFTGAIRRTRGRFELADGGTILLDEIGEISPSVQAKLLRILQQREFERVGGEDTLRVDVRILATTNKDLKAEIQAGNFREDLFYRLNVVPIYIPPLRERKEDIPLLAEHFLRKHCEQNGVTIKTLSREALDLLMGYNWPGNVRELENSIERAIVMTREETLHPRHFLLGRNMESSVHAAPMMENEPLTLSESEKRLILRTLERENGNRTRTAEALGISIRTLRNKLKQYREEGLI